MAEQKLGRNDPCSCGSGKKFKKCCELKTERNRATMLLGLLVGAILVAGLAAAVSSFSTDHTSSATTGVWSPEHGHYH
jgi:hypothetical protein